MTDIQDIELRSEEVKEILGMPPSWVIRWGTTAIVLILLSLLILSYFIQYPDTITGALTLNAAGKPLEISIKEDGNLDDLFIFDEEEVTKGQQLGMIKNGLEYVPYTSLKESLEDMYQASRDSITEVYPIYDVKLGSFEAEYEQIKQNLEIYKESVKPIKSVEVVGRLKNKERAIRNEIKIKEDYINTQKRLLGQLSRDMEGYRRSLALMRMENNPGQKLKNAYKDSTQVSGSITRERGEISRLNRELKDIKGAIKSEKKTDLSGNDEIWNDFRNQVIELREKIYQWEKDYLILAPIDGVVNYYNAKPQEIYYKKGDPIFAIFSQENSLSDTMYAQVLIKEEGYGKVKKGQEVLIKFDSYPHLEYGKVQGKVTKKAHLQNNKSYSLEVELPRQLITTFGEPLDIKPTMTGEAEILTEKRRLIERLFERFRGIFK